MKTKTSPTRPTEVPALDTLEAFVEWARPKSAEEVAQYLRSEGVQGRHGPHACPLAMLFTSRYGEDHMRVLVGPTGLERRGYGGLIYAWPNSGVEGFINSYDHGHFPDLCMVRGCPTHEKRK